MKTLLEITSSARGSASRSTQLAGEVVARLTERFPDARIVTRDVAATPVPVLDAAALAALGTPAEARTAAQREVVATHDALIAELQEADVVVLGVPMYNFFVPTQLKAWFDAVARAGVTFRYGPNGAEGLLRGKKVYVVLGRGGVHRGQPSDLQTPFLQTILGFLGMTDVEFVFAEGLDMGPEAQAHGLAEARAAIAAL
ncbi:MAG: NAD(P)H-dependent oxidoreductase [Polyangiales bacterium]